MRQLSRCTSRFEIMNHFCTVYGTCRSMMTPIVDEGRFIYFISNSGARRELGDSRKIPSVPTRSRTSEIPISSSHADSEKLGKIRMFQKRSRTCDLPIIIMLETREGRGKETRVSRALGSKENPLKSSKESTCFSLCWFC